MKPPTVLVALLAGLLAGVLGGVIGTQLTARPAEPVTGPAVLPDRLVDRIAGLERRLAEERGGEPLAPASVPQRTGGLATEPPPGLEELSARVAGLERALAELRAAGVDSPDPSFGTPGSREALVAELESLGTPRDRYHPPARARRIELREELLEKYPDSPDAGDHLLALANDHVGAGQAELAQAAMDRFRGRVEIESWRFEQTYANTLTQQGRAADGRDVLMQVAADSSAPVHARAEAEFYHAYSYMREGSYDEAQLGFESLITTWESSSDPAVPGLIAGAKTQLAKIEEWRKP